MPLIGRRESVRIRARPIFFELSAVVPLNRFAGLGGDTEPYMESLILAQNERWRRA